MRERWTKIPRRLDGRNASSTNRNDWVSFDAAYTAYQSGKGDGLGFITTREDGYMLVDFDHVIDLTTGTIAPWAYELVQTAHRKRGSYCEVSVSRTGLHLFLRSKRVFDGIKTPDGLEIYTHGRFFTMSGWRFP
jgi:putative DNA primase/helicase